MSTLHFKTEEINQLENGRSPERKFDVCPPFTNVTLDLAGPITMKAMTNSRASMKVWPKVIICLNTGAVTILLIHNYRAEVFMLHWNLPRLLVQQIRRIQVDGTGVLLKVLQPDRIKVGDLYHQGVNGEMV